MITTILTHTPVWVDGLFVYLVVMGIAALRPQTVSVTRLLIVPTLFVAMGLFMLVSGHAGLTAVLAWSLALMLALPLGILTSTPLLAVGVWYPSSAPASPHALGPVTQTVAQDAPVAPGPHALVVISHGNGGWFASHLDTAQALAVAGFVVAAPTHAGDNYRDQSHATDIAARPNQLRAVIDAMLTQWQGHAAIDPRRIGLFGFSAGGLSVLIAAGGVPDLALVAPYCATHTTGYVCTLIHAYPPADTAPPVWTHDPRVRAIVVASPALGFAFGPTGLAGIHVPVQLWQADQDHILPPPDDVAPVLAGLRRGGMPVEFHPIPGADHWDFLAPCTPALAKLAPQICGEISGFDRAAFHRTFDADIVGFFRRTLATP